MLSFQLQQIKDMQKKKETGTMDVKSLPVAEILSYVQESGIPATYCKALEGLV